MELTNPQQIATLKAAIIADPNLAAARAIHSGVGTQMITDYLNSSGSLTVWRTSVSTSILFDSVVWSSLTPNDAPDATQAWECRSLACQGKQFNLQLIFGSRDTIDPSKSNVRAGLQDALTNIPSGSGGALVSAGWVGVRTAMQRKATNLEAIFSNTAASPASLVVEGEIDEMTIRKLAFADNGDWLL